MPIVGGEERLPGKFKERRPVGDQSTLLYYTAHKLYQAWTSSEAPAPSPFPEDPSRLRMLEMQADVGCDCQGERASTTDTQSLLSLSRAFSLRHRLPPPAL